MIKPPETDEFLTDKMLYLLSRTLGPCADGTCECDCLPDEDEAQSTPVVTMFGVKGKVGEPGSRPRGFRPTSAAHDPVNTPSHYTQGDVECIDAIRSALGDAGFAMYCRGNAIKYTWRTGLKGASSEDMAKARLYLQWAMDADMGAPLRK